MPTRSSDDRHSVSPRRISRFVPAATAVVCAGIMVVGFAELGGASIAPTSRTGGSGCYSHTTTGPTTQTAAPAPNALGAAARGTAKTVTATRTKTVTKTVTRTKTIVKCVTKTVTGPGSTTTVTVTQGGPTSVSTTTVTETQTGTNTTTTETVTVVSTVTPAV